MLKEFREFINSEKIFNPCDHVLLAVSGGMDSSAMAWLFSKSGCYFGIAHCNFGLRGMESDGDEYFVKEMAAKYRVPFYCRHFETKKYANQKGISVQMAARELRYYFFNEIIEKQDYKYISTAHHRDDEIETFFINLCRGTGISGLTGYSPVNGNIIHPMLFTSRKEINEHVLLNKIKFREDSSNESDNYIRNKIRHHLIPLLKEINPNAENAILTGMERLGNIDNIYRHIIGEKRKEIITQKDGLIKININKLLKLPAPDAHLFEFLYPFGFSGDIIKSIFESANKQAGKVFFSATNRLVKDRNYFLITEVSAGTKDQEYYAKMKDKEIIEPVKIKFSVIANSDDLKIPSEKNIAYFDLDKLHFPLLIRRWKRGDSFYPYGMRGKKKLSDFFTDKKFSLVEKENIWLLCSNNNIIWIIGHRNDNRYKVTAKTKKIFVAKLTGQ